MSDKYKNGKIYTIRYKNDDSLIYVGSTVQPLFKRWHQHKSRVNNEVYNTLDTYVCMYVCVYVCMYVCIIVTPGVETTLNGAVELFRLMKTDFDRVLEKFPILKTRLV